MRYVVVTELSCEVEPGKAVTHAAGAVVDRDAIPETSIPWLLEQGHIRPVITQAVAPAPDAHSHDAPHNPGGGRRRRGEE